MSARVHVPRGRSGLRLICVSAGLMLAGAGALTAVLAVTSMAAANFEASVAHRPSALGDWHLAETAREGGRRSRAPVAASVFADRERLDDLFRSADAARRDDEAVGAKLAAAAAPARVISADEPIQIASAGPVALDLSRPADLGGFREIRDDQDPAPPLGSRQVPSSPSHLTQAPWPTSPGRGEVDAASAAAGEGHRGSPERAETPHPALRADLSPLGRGEDPRLSPDSMAPPSPGQESPATRPVAVAALETAPASPAPAANPIVPLAVAPAFVPMPRPRPADVASMAPPVAPARPSRGPTLAYAAPEIDTRTDGPGDFFRNLMGRAEGLDLPRRGSGVAIYDIASATVRLPNGEKLEAHSGLAHRQDNPAYVREKNKGPTPPNVYDLRMREALFHGTEAIRLTPRDQRKVFNRDGLLAHSYMYAGGGSRSQSNGCVVFKDYGRFLRAFKAGEVAKLVVVPNMAELQTYMAGL